MSCARVSRKVVRAGHGEVVETEDGQEQGGVVFDLADGGGDRVVGRPGG